MQEIAGVLLWSNGPAGSRGHGRAQEKRMNRKLITHIDRADAGKYVPASCFKRNGT